MRRLFRFRKATQVLMTLMVRRRRHARRLAAAMTGNKPTVGRHRSLLKSPTPGGKNSTSRKRRRSHDPAATSGQTVGGEKSTSTSNNSSTPAGSMTCSDPKEGGEILVLFETPSGFAIFCLKDYCLNQPNAMEKIWAIFGMDYRLHEIVCLKDFQTFKDKSSAINHGTGVKRELTDMIMRHHRPCQPLAVGNPEYKRIIETSLGVPCVFDETVTEVMWGLKNLMHMLVPQEDVQLTREDRLPMSQGLKMYLGRHGFDVKPEMVNEEVVATACVLVDAEKLEKSHVKSLCWAAEKLKDVSGIDSEGWAPMKISKALKIISHTYETTKDDWEMFTREELSTLARDARKYDEIFRRDIVLEINNELVEMREVKRDHLEILGQLLA